jgi:hypothetical protein
MVRILTIPLLKGLLLFTANYNRDKDPILENDTVNTETAVGFELMESRSMDSILVWNEKDILTQEQYDEIDFALLLQKNSPGAGITSFSESLRSPVEKSERDFITAEHFGYNWLINVQVLNNTFRIACE